MSINFDHWTVKIFSSQNATTGHTKSFLLLSRLSFKFVFLILSNSKKPISSSAIWFLTVLEVFFIFPWTAEGVGIWLLGTPGHTDGGFLGCIFPWTSMVWKFEGQCCSQITVLFLSFRVFRLLSSSLFLYSHFGWHVLQPSSGVYRTQDPSRNFKPRPLFNSFLLFICSQDWTRNLQTIVSLEP